MRRTCCWGCELETGVGNQSSYTAQGWLTVGLCFTSQFYRVEGSSVGLIPLASLADIKSGITEIPKGPSINYVRVILAIFDPPYTHVRVRKIFKPLPPILT